MMEQSETARVLSALCVHGECESPVVQQQRRPQRYRQSGTVPQ